MNETKTKGAVLSDRYVPDSSTNLGNIAGVVGAVGSRSANFASSMSLADMLNVGVTAIAANRGEHLMGMPATAAGVAIKSDPSNFLSAAALSGGWALTGVVGLSIYIIGNVYVTLHQRLLAHHDAVVSLYKCYGMLLRIENFLKAAEIYCKTYNFQVDSLEIQDDLMNVFRVLDEMTTQDDIKKVYANVQQGITFTLDSAGPNDQVIASPTQGHPFKSFFSNRGRAIWNSTGAVFHKLTTNVTKWCNRFNAVMIEINMHFTLLNSEFFMLANIYQMQSPTRKNEDFANRMMNEAVINDKQNPLWCIKLQIMLAPFLRVRNILFSCALSTNTELCRLTANREMQVIDRTNGFNGEALWAYLKRLGRLYTIEEAKTINVGLFLDILRNAVKNVEDNCYFKSLPPTDDNIRITVNELSALLMHSNISSDHALFMKVINLLDEIYKIVLACGRANQQGFIDLESNQFHSDHFTASRMHYKERASTNLELVATTQLRPFYYANAADTFSDIDEIANFVTGKCIAISLLPPTVDEYSYDVGAHSTDSDRAIAVRLRNMIRRPTITTDAAVADAAALADAASASVIPGLMEVQKAYNTLYKFVMTFDQSSTRMGNIVEKRGKWLAGCILLIERAITRTVLLSKKDINDICEKCKTLINMIKTHNPEQSLNQMPVLFQNTSMVNIIRKITTLSEGVKGSAAAAAPAAAAPAAAAAVSIADLARAASGSAAAAPMQPQPIEMSKTKRALNAVSAFGSAVGKTLRAPFQSEPKNQGKLTDRLLNAVELSESGGTGGGRNKLRKTRRFNRNRTKRLYAYRRRLNLNLNRSRRSHTRRR